MSVIGGKADMTRTGRDGDAPMLVAIDGIDGIDRFPDQEKLNFLAKGLEGSASEGSRNRLASLLSYSEMSATVIKL
jgi:hypothetical protein